MVRKNDCRRTGSSVRVYLKDGTRWGAGAAGWGPREIAVGCICRLIFILPHVVNLARSDHTQSAVRRRSYVPHVMARALGIFGVVALEALGPLVVWTGFTTPSLPSSLS